MATKKPVTPVTPAPATTNPIVAVCATVCELAFLGHDAARYTRGGLRRTAELGAHAMDQLDSGVKEFTWD